MTTAKTKPKPLPRRNLTRAQKAEAIAMWRAGTVTLEDLSRKFGKRTEAFSRLFKLVGVKKGELAEVAAAKVIAAAEEVLISSTQVTLNRIQETKEEHFKYNRAFARILWQEVSRARAADIPLGSLKDTMVVLKLAADAMGNIRKDQFSILNVERHDKIEVFDELPELTVRELTGGEIETLKNQMGEDDELLDDVLGEDMLPEDDAEST